MDKNRKPNRLKEYDYSNPAWYFVTICTHKHIQYFGKMKNSKMQLNSIGKVADKFWFKIKTLHTHVDLDDYIVMPNHIHGIIIIDEDEKNSTVPVKQKFNTVVGDANFASPTDRTKMELSKLIQQFKRAVTIEVKSNYQTADFKWQRSFYDRIIRNEKELYHIRDYILKNPAKWEIEKGINNLEL